MCHYPSHRPLHPRAESAARDHLRFYIQGECMWAFFLSLVDCYCHPEGLEWKSDSRIPFSLEECRELLDFLEKLNKEDQYLDMSSPAAHPLSQSSARTAFVSWILLHVGMFSNVTNLCRSSPNSPFFIAHHSKTVHFGLKAKPQATQVRRLGRLWSILVSFLLFWYPFYRGKCVGTVRKNSMPQYNQNEWSTYIESLASTRSTFNSVV